MKKNYFLLLLLITSLSSFNLNAQVSHLVISQIYGGGGNSGAPYTNDFIEIFNPTGNPVSLTGWSVQYASAAGTSWAITALSGSISPGQYYLIQEAAGGTPSTALPTPDATGGINMSATAGKVALVNSTTALTGSGCPFGVTIVDFAGFGTTADCREGGATTAFNTPAPSNTTSVLRANNGCTDSDNNSSDFATGSPNPRNTSSPINLCTQASTVSVSAGNNMAEPATNGTFNITLSSAAPAGGVTVNYSLSGIAVLNTDYTDPQGGSITITQGNSSGTVTLNVTDDPTVEGTETIIITLNSATNGYTASGNATINLLDNDVAPPSTISLTGIYSQNFNTLAITGTSSTLPAGWLFAESGTNANTTYTAGNGSGTAGDTYSFGSTSLADRAFGGLQSGSLIPTIGAGITNNTGGTISALKIIYTGEQWRLGALNREDRLDFQYSINATSLTTGTWTDINQLDFTAPVQTPVAGALDGNASANRTLISYSITGLSIPDGATFYIRWNDFNASGADDGLSIDDFSIEANPADMDPPVVTLLFPANGASNVSTNLTASLTFNETVQKGTGNIIIKKTSDNSVVQTIDVTTASVSVSTTTVSFNLSGLAENTGYYIEINNGAFKDIAENNFEGISGNSTWAFTTGNIFYSANFQTCSSSLTDGFTQYSITGDIVWACTAFGRDPAAPAGSAPFPNAVQINGFANGTNVPNIDWLISPSFDLTGTTFPLLSFWSRTAFNGSPLQLKVSTDYVSGDPTLATWTDINGKFPGQTSNIWTLSSNINLSAFKQSNIHFAFVYTSTNEDGARWTLDDISIANSAIPPPPSLTVSTTDIQFTYVASGSTADKTFTFIGNDLTGGVEINSTGVFTLSKDGTAFNSSLSYTAGEANNLTKTVYVRFAPTQNNQNYTGTVTIATSELSASVNLKGTSIDPATTLEVVNWNLEWFGSTDPSLGPTNDGLQEQNVKTIMQNIGADIFGLVEVVDTARLGNIVRSMPGYSYIICNYGSHVNPPDPSGGPVTEAQKEAFVYKTQLFSNITTRPLINNQDISSTSYNSWSSGRYPFLMTADVTLNCVTKKINFVLVHAKANTSPTATSYARREAGANELHDTLMTYFPTANVIMLGDFNDDLDQSITAGFTITSYHAFTTDNANFFSPTLALSLAGKKSTVSFNDVIDHVMLTNDMQPYYMASSANILTDVSTLVSNYGSTTTDHYPVFTRYQFEAPAPPAITLCPSVSPFCESSNGNYTIPAIAATSVCGTVNYSFSISGATVRTGTSNNASGSFNIGTSVITWTATDGIGNASTCTTTVVVNANPSVSIPDAFAMSSGVLANTVYIGYAPASSITLTSNVSGGTPLYSYSWSSGSLVASATVSPTTNTTYTLTVTDAKGCQGTASKAITVMDIRGGQKSDKVIICHKSNTIVINPDSVPAHLAHGDMLGSCQPVIPSIVRNSIREKENSIPAKLTVTAQPNPSANYFIINVAGGNASEKLGLRVTDILGRTIEQKDNLQYSNTIKIGNDYRPGVYIVEIIQGTVRKQIKLLKAPAN